MTDAGRAAAAAEVVPGTGAAAVRQLWAEALARRAATQPEPVRRLLNVRLAALAQVPPGPGGAATGRPIDRSDRCVSVVLANGPGSPESATKRGRLGRLADALAHGKAVVPSASVAATLSLPAPEAAPPELQVLQRFRSTWSRLAAEERVQQALAQVPPQAGPLNSSQLVYRALLLMRETSPEYLQRFVPYVDALLWLEKMQTPGPVPATRATVRRKAGTRKR